MTREWSRLYVAGIWGTGICIAIPFLLAYVRYVHKWWVREQARTQDEKRTETL